MCESAQNQNTEIFFLGTVKVKSLKPSMLITFTESLTKFYTFILVLMTC